MRRVYLRQPMMRLSDAAQTRHNDTLATEEPLKLRVADRTLAITMRTQIHPACSA
jgi:formate dehydrogenase assembly factor FdhD